MNYVVATLSLIFSLHIFAGCTSQKTEVVVPAAALTQAELSALANAVESSGPREGNNYKVFFLVKRQNQAPGAGFKVDAYVKGKSEPITVRTNESGLAQFDNLPFPGAKNKLVAVLHYYKGAEDQPREIVYPFLKSDAYRLKDIQYIPNTVTPDPS